MNDRLRFIVFIIAIIIGMMLFGCADNGGTDPDFSLEARYQDAIEDAVFAEESEICHQLTAITPENEALVWSDNDSLVLMVTWTNYPESYPVGDTVNCWWGETWVTAVPDLQNWLTYHELDPNSPDLRLQQLLGLPPESEHSHFVEFWVSPNSLFRPTPDPEIDDQSAELTFSNTVSNDYISWFNNNIINSYFPLKYPWTRLGYTYDWGSDDSEVGLSEFVVSQAENVVVEGVYTTQEYIVTASPEWKK